MTRVEEHAPSAGGQPGRGQSAEAMVLTVELTGDRVAAESVILEILALAQKIGLKVPKYAVVQRPAINAKTVAPASDPVLATEFD